MGSRRARSCLQKWVSCRCPLTGWTCGVADAPTPRRVLPSGARPGGDLWPHRRLQQLSLKHSNFLIDLLPSLNRPENQVARSNVLPARASLFHFAYRILCHPGECPLSLPLAAAAARTLLASWCSPLRGQAIPRHMDAEVPGSSPAPHRAPPLLLPFVSRTGVAIRSRLPVWLRLAPVVPVKLAVTGHHQEEKQWPHRVIRGPDAHRGRAQKGDVQLWVSCSPQSPARPMHCGAVEMTEDRRTGCAAWGPSSVLAAHLWHPTP